MNTIVNRIQRVIAIHGFWGILNLFSDIFSNFLLQISPFHKQTERIGQNNSLEFDLRWGVDTSGVWVPQKTDVVGPNWKYGANCQGSNPAILNQILSELPIRHNDFTFIDLGSGKGRALLVASRFQFKKIIGVEYSKQIIDIARNNVNRFPEKEKKCFYTELIHCDATKLSIPSGPLVIFLANPFAKPVLEEVVRNVVSSYKEVPRRIIVVYLINLYRELWINSGIMNEVQNSKLISIFDTNSNLSIISS
jgi:SAM-dependent methyltransferase